MKGCIDVDRLVTLGAAIDWKTEGVLDHLLACSDCREELGRMAMVHGALSAQEPVPPEVIGEVMSELSARREQRPSIERVLTRALTAVLAGMTTVFALTLVVSGASGASGTSTVSFGPVAGAAVAVALAMAWWGDREAGAARQEAAG